MKFTDWVQEELIPFIAVTSLYGVVIPSTLLIGATFTVDSLNIVSKTKLYDTVRYKSYAIGACSGLIGIISFTGSFTLYITSKRQRQHRLLQNRLAEIERMNSESRELTELILSQVPSNCKSCKYYTKDVYLLCSVHPTDIKEDCNDWEGK